MDPISIEGTPKTPTVNFDADKGLVEIKGRSIPENSIEFYKPLVDWLEGYSSGPAGSTTVNVQLEYFNTSSSKCILDVFKKLEAIENHFKDKHYRIRELERVKKEITKNLAKEEAEKVLAELSESSDKNKEKTSTSKSS